MAAKLDVTARLAEGRTAVDNTQSYVWACHLLNYQNPDLTLHSAQVRDWYSSEDGLDLHVLDADHFVLQAVSAAADDALRRQRDQLDSLAAAWQGDGATSAQDFVRRHCGTAENVATAVRTAADTLAGLRDALWAIVDKKVAAVGAIDDRRQTEQPAWVGAAQTVITGAGDRAAASELVDRQVKPFVDNDIRTDWLATVRTAIASIGSSFDAAIAGLTSVAQVQFDVPGDLGPQRQPQPQASAEDPAPTTRAAVAPVPSPAAPSSSPVPSSSPMPAMEMPAMAPMQMPAMSAMPAGVGATPTSAAPAPAAAPSGLESFGQRFADMLDGLVPSPSDAALPEPPTPEPAEQNVDEPKEDEAEDEADEGETNCSGTEHKEGEPAPVAEVEIPQPEPPAPAPPPVAPPPPEPPAADTGTPCEIAADELPQAGQ